ncbi:unnamed protein product [Rhizophagus irregularis]|nr:unnamed protein product [Rhizophagus irregularis]
MNTSEPEPQQSSELKISDIFKNHEEFVARVQNYASYCNFQIRLSKVGRDKEKNIIRRTILCSRAGVSESKEDKVNSRDCKSQRCNCPFFIRASLDNNSGLWHILAMNLEHNHEMVAPEHKMFLSSERIIPQEIKDRIIVYHQAGCNVPTIRSILKQEYKDLETWIYNDIYNFIYQLNGKQEQRFFEAEEFINILKQLKREIDGFEYEVRVDVDTNELLQVIWMYPDQKRYYSRFLDVIVFDNTYKVNRFNMPFGIFTGINNFGQSVCFAGTLMCRETIDSFVWVFNTFLKFVNNYSPKVMLTDEDKAISQAIEITFGQNTKHVLCIWHLWKNVIKNIANVLGTKWREFTKSFYDCIREYEVDNFIIKWQQLKENFPDSKSHLERMDKIKEKWAPCFIRDTFLADMTTKYKQIHENVTFKTLSPLEYQASEILTNYALKLTQEQLLQSTSYLCIELLDSRTETMQTYQIYRFNHETKPGRKVVHNGETNHFVCSCKYTTFSGIICRHIFRVATQLNLNNLPESLFHNQWRKDPSNLVLTQNFHLFCNNIQSPNDKIIERVEDYEYLLSKVFHEIKGLVKKYPEMAQEFYTTNNTLLQNRIKSANNQKTCKSTTKNLIRNPQTATNNSKKREKKSKVMNDLSNKKWKTRSNNSSGLSLQEKENIPKYDDKKNDNINASSSMHRVFQNLPQISVTELMDMEMVEIDNGLSKKKDNELFCLFCNQSLPNPLPKKLLDYLKILQNKDKILETDRAEFCFMHYAETAIV